MAIKEVRCLAVTQGSLRNHTWDVDTRILKKTLQIGTAYLFKDGTVKVFIGVSQSNALVFYAVGCALLQESKSEKKMSLLHEDLQLNYLKSLSTAIVTSPKALSHGAICAYSKMPFICSPLFSLYGDNIPMPVRVFFDNIMQSVERHGEKLKKEKKECSDCVAVKDLVPGQVYQATEEGWHAFYLYMGRQQKKFVWVPIANITAWSNDPMRYIGADGVETPILKITAHNLKVRPLTAERLPVVMQRAMKYYSIKLPEGLNNVPVYKELQY